MKNKKRPVVHGAAVLFAMLPLMLALSPGARAAPECAEGMHQYSETRRTAATEALDGEVAYLCAICGQQYKEILYATDHNWGPWIIDRQPTCTRPGEKHRICDRALRHEEYTVIPAIEHNYAASITTEPGCGKEGVETFACTHCGTKYTKPIPLVEHDYEEAIAKEPFCFAPGIKRFVCVHDPAHAYEEEIPAIGSHNFGEWTVETPAGEGVEGLEARVCARDGFRETRKLAALPVPRAISAADIVLVGANVGFAGFFAFLFIPYFLCLRYIKKRRGTVERRNMLRKKMEAYYGFK